MSTRFFSWQILSTALVVVLACALTGLLPTSTYAEAQPITNETLNSFNPLVRENSPQAQELSTPGGILSRVLLFSFPIAGMILFVMIIWGGFQMLAGATTKKSVDEGQQRITNAIVGFILLFCSYWIIQIVQFMLGISLL